MVVGSVKCVLTNVFNNVTVRYFAIYSVRLKDESLRWLIANGRVVPAKAIIQKACKQNKKDYETVLSGTGFSEWEMRMSKKALNIQALGSL